jgi:hypothetical protein
VSISGDVEMTLPGGGYKQDQNAMRSNSLMISLQQWRTAKGKETEYIAAWL